MPWLSSQSKHRRSSLPVSWRNPRGKSRNFSWFLCTLVLLIILFWPSPPPSSSSRKQQKKPDSSDKNPAIVARERTIAPAAAAAAKNRNPGQAKAAKGESREHVYRLDGLLEVNAKGSHPIMELIDRSETQWKRKLERQSKTLDAAVREYRRRYKRPPPKHFEVWYVCLFFLTAAVPRARVSRWDYVTYHNVQLVDEYDSIHARLQPFWGVDPVQLRAAQAESETFGDTFTIGKLHDDDTVVLLNSTMPGSPLDHQRVQDQLELIDEVQDWLPAFRATFTIHDGPMQFVSWEMRKAAVDAAERGECAQNFSLSLSLPLTLTNALTDLDVKRMASQITDRGWSAACPPNTPIHDRHFPPPGESNSPSSAPPPSAVKCFIYNHRLSMSPCHHPLHLLQSGFLAQYHYSHQFGPSPSHMLAPTFAISTSPLHNDLLSPAPEQWVDQDEMGIDPPWADKVDERLLWRGSNTGTLFQEGGDWNTSQRIRLVAMGTRRGGETRVLFPRGDRTSGVGFGENVKWNVLNSAFMDVAFVGNPVQCRGDLCEILQDMFEWRKKQSYTEAWHYKYIMDVGVSSPLFQCLLAHHALLGGRQRLVRAVQTPPFLQLSHPQIHRLSRMVYGAHHAMGALCARAS